jgi:hypothetical protein
MPPVFVVTAVAANSLFSTSPPIPSHPGHQIFSVYCALSVLLTMTAGTKNHQIAEFVFSELAPRS